MKTIEITRCCQCPNHKVIADPDPNDSFNADDCAIVCTKMKQTPNKQSKHLADHSEFRIVECGIRPYHTNNVEIPHWCPL